MRTSCHETRILGADRCKHRWRSAALFLVLLGGSTALSLALECCPTEIIYDGAFGGEVGQQYTAYIVQETCPCVFPDLCPHYTWTESGALPPGLTFTGGYAIGASLIGYPTTPGTWSFTVELQGANGCERIRPVTLQIIPPQPQVLSIAPTSGPASGETPVVVTGTGFLPGASLSIGGMTASDVVVISPTEIDGDAPALVAGTLNDVTVTNATGIAAGWFADFLDVPQGSSFHDYVEKVVRAYISVGCGGGNYCPDNVVTRAQMAVFMLKAENGPAFVPPSCTGIFEDVPCPGPFADWIEEFYRDGFTGGCGAGNYCPSSSVTRAQTAVFLLKTRHGSNYAPPSCTGIFGDVPCPGAFADWIEELYIEGVTSGCSRNPLLYCPNTTVTRGPMAIFITKNFL